MTLSTRLIVLFIAVVLCGAASGQNEQPDMRKYCVIMPYERRAEIMLLLMQAKRDVGWEDETHLHQAMDKLDRVETLLHFTSSAEVCPKER